ncbi:FtsH protease activity modulator HflK [Candidatus Blochmannia ocreatus (nom. nud.)]|uniref:FtsH protease activity modulator HflK n=1 Tax=Candidatus Blochmannia ocreatus (nom. nud.) TaxID=251538 RepID=UPI003C6C9DE0
MFDIEKFFNKKNNIFSNKNTEHLPQNKKFFIALVLSIVILVWLFSGLYTIKEAERGVVLRFGKYHHLVKPGLNWKPTFFDIIIPVNVESVRELAASGVMLTSDENVVRVEMNVQYRVTDPKNYLFNVTDADDSLRQATDSALRGVIGKYNMDRILTEGRTVIRSDTRRILEKTIYPYNMGITLLDVNFQTARPPEEVKAAFDDAIAARENEQQYIREAEAYANEVQPRANGQAQRILEEGRAYKARTILEAQGEVQRFLKILPEYRLAPDITRERLYINSMERVLSNTKKMVLSSKNIQNMFILPYEKTKKITNKDDIVKYSNKFDQFNHVNNSNLTNAIRDSNNLKLVSRNNSHLSQKTMGHSSVSKEKVLDQRQANTQRVDIMRKGRE